MKLMGAFLLGLALALPAWGAQIVPEFVDTPNGFGPGQKPPENCVVVWDAFNGQAIECDLVVPKGAYEIAGWSGYVVDLSPFAPWAFSQAGYQSIEVWHKGTVPHRLSNPHWGPGVFTFPDFAYPAGDGHKAQEGDRVFARFRCTGFSFLWTHPLCTASLTVNFRVQESH